MTRTLLIILSAFAALAALSLLPLRLRLAAAAAPLGAELRFAPSLFRRPAGHGFTLRFALLRGGVRVFLVTKRGVILLKKRKKRRKRKKPQRLFPALLRAVDIPELSVSGRVGLRNDPAASALIAGTLGGIIDSAERIAFARLPCGLPETRRIRLLPVFSGEKPFFRIGAEVRTNLFRLIIGLLNTYLLKEFGKCTR